VLDGLTGHDQDLLASARLVAADLYNAFGSPEVRHITADGKLRVGHFRGDTQQLQQLAGERGVVLTDEGVPGE
jgi:hypothetical protein